MEDNQNNPLSPNPVGADNARPGLTEGVWSIICAVLSLAFLPPVLGALSIYLAYRAKKKGRVTLGTVGMALGIVCMILGLFFGFVFSVGFSGKK